MEFTRQCPTCGKELSYRTKGEAAQQTKRNANCKDCSFMARRKSAIRNCPMCAKEITHTSASNCGAAKKINRPCVECADRARAKTSHTRRCPTCNEEIYHTDRRNCMKAIKGAVKCRVCTDLAQRGKQGFFYGKIGSLAGGRGWSGWYKDKFHFRSLLELSFILSLEREGRVWESGEQKKYMVPYTNEHGVDATYSPDFIVGLIVYEIKPIVFQTSTSVLLKKAAAEKHFSQLGYEYMLVEPKELSIKQIKFLAEQKTVIFHPRTQEKYNKRIGKTPE